ncbi:MAG TPA: methyltransferase [Ruania sp.]|nr:methyltransferase [Ruania sp.]
MTTWRTRPTRQVQALRADLRAAEYTVDHLTELFGPEVIAAMAREQVVPAVRRARTLTDPAAVLARLFILGDQVTPAEVATVLPRSAGYAGELGLLTTTTGGTVQALLDLRPVDLGTGALYLAADLGEATTGHAVQAEHVLGLGGASRTLAELTVPTPAARALDLGTGSGVQALALAGRCAAVTGTDISTRALTYAALNADLNGLDLDLRKGSMLDPVAGETFDLIVSNPPFVITPRAEGALPAYTYRDAGGTGDAMAEALVTGLGAHLAPGGVAQLLLNWEIHEATDPLARVRDWCTRSGLDAWVVGREIADPCEYAETWLRDGGITPDRDRRAWDRGYAAWLADFEARGVLGVGFGYLTLHRARGPAGEQWLRTENLTGHLPGPLGPAIAATLAVKDALAGLDDAALAALPLTVAPDVTEERHYRPGSAHPEVIMLHQGGGFGRSVRADTALAAVVGASDGELTPAQAAAGVAVLTDTAPHAVLQSVIADIRGLVLDGFLHLPGYREE